MKVVFGKPFESPQKVRFGQARAGVATIRRAAKVSIFLTGMASLTGCVSPQPSTALDGLKGQAAACADRLADGSQQEARAACLAHLAQLEAALNW